MYGVLSGLMDVGKGVGLFQDMTPEEQAAIQSLQQKLAAKHQPHKMLVSLLDKQRHLLVVVGLFLRFRKGRQGWLPPQGLVRLKVVLLLTEPVAM
ncbi:prophage protein [Escherichia coli]|uniref:Prophage protein n=1 Tax=Escherichia coli TaxID=562 RepID=A0A377C9B4_ECOLX|nr:prophage protein [Escherichia coli]